MEQMSRPQSKRSGSMRLFWESPHRFLLTYGETRVVGIIDDIQATLARDSRYIVRMWADDGQSNICVEMTCPVTSLDHTRVHIQMHAKQLLAAAEYAHRAWHKA